MQEPPDECGQKHQQNADGLVAVETRTCGVAEPGFSLFVELGPDLFLRHAS